MFAGPDGPARLAGGRASEDCRFSPAFSGAKRPKASRLLASFVALTPNRFSGAHGFLPRAEAMTGEIACPFAGLELARASSNWWPDIPVSCLSALHHQAKTRVAFFIALLLNLAKQLPAAGCQRARNGSRARPRAASVIGCPVAAWRLLLLSVRNHSADLSPHGTVALFRLRQNRFRCQLTRIAAVGRGSHHRIQFDRDTRNSALPKLTPRLDGR